MTVLLLGVDEQNYDPTEVSRLLVEAGAPVVRINLREVLTKARASASFGAQSRYVLRAGSTELDCSDVTAVWLRASPDEAIPKGLQHLDPGIAQICWSTTQQHLFGLLSELNVFHLDPYFNVLAALNKLKQLDAAVRLGIAIPRTLISNDAEAVRAFARGCAGGLVTKMLTTHFVPISGKERAGAVFTNAVEPDDLRDLRGLDLCPMIFQEQIPKRLEIRATVVGQRVFSAAVDSQIAEGGRVDWRRDQGPLLGTWRPYDLPGPVQEKLLKLHDAFGLNYGASDLILTPEGQHIFLEVNPLGGFNWLETNMDPGHFPISVAVADLLLKRAPPRSFGS